MAFHPFGFFRKRQKTMLALLTILSMVIFILTGFTGSIFDRMNYWFGSGRGGDKSQVTTLYGKTITVGDMDQLRHNRQAADNFILASIETAEPPTSGIDPEAKKAIDQLAQSIKFMRQLPPQFLPQILPSVMRDYESLRRERQTLARQGKTEAANYAAALARPIGLMFWRQMHPGQLYFGGTLAVDDLLDFLL